MPTIQHTRHTASTQTRGEAAASAAFDRARVAGALQLHAFLERMPKGGDLHMHLSGAVYAETFLKDGAEDHLCIDPNKLEFAKPSEHGCAAPLLPAAQAFRDQALYDRLIDSFSMRGFVPAPGTTGHDQFFATFARFGGTSKVHRGEWLDEVATRAAAQNEQYLEIMETPSFSHAAQLGEQLGWPGGTGGIVTTAATSAGELSNGASEAELSRLRDRLLAAGLREEVAVDRAEYADALARRRELEGCGTPTPKPACSVEIRFLYQVLRSAPPQRVFAQTLLAFEVADAEAATGKPNVVGLNFVQPEDAYLAMSEYHRQMLMLAYLHKVYPRVHISLHAGELAPGMVPPAGLGFHIREAVELAGAERIGHGVDVMEEHAPDTLLAEMAARHIMVEINLTSNDVILGVTSNRHSLPAYQAAGVPVALSTDDEGVSRIDLTHEYARAAKDFGLGYGDLKRMARTSLQHSFLPGRSLWAAPDEFRAMVPECAGSGAEPGDRCRAFLQESDKARQQFALEERFARFEASVAAVK